MFEDSDELLTIILDVFGTDYRKHNSVKKQISVDCPVCDDGGHKGNLEINYGKLVMKCWKCGDDSDGLKGSLRTLIKKYGKNRDLKLYDSVVEDYRPEYEKESYIENYKPKIKLPKEYISFNDSQKDYQYFKAYNYLIGRGLTDDIISKHDIGYCTSGDFGGRIIIPSYDQDGDLNYYIARSYVNHKISYKNPEVNKTDVIINQQSINWDSTIYIVEGMFDLLGLGIDNTIPLLGKYLFDKLYYLLITKAKANIVICLDPDAKRNAYKIYQKLQNTPQLHDKVRIIDLPLNLDISKIRELYGQKGVIKCLKLARKLKLTDFIENAL